MNTIKKHRYTSMSRTRFLELRQQWIDGTLREKWAVIDASTITAHDNVESRQIRAIAMLLGLDNNQFHMLYTTKWRELVVTKDDTGNYSIQVYT